VGKVNLQNILFPKTGICSDKKLYMRLKKGASYDESSRIIRFESQSSAQFDTYFNGFSIEKWKKYTRIDNLELHLRMKGPFQILLVGKEKLNSEIIEKTIGAFDFSSAEPKEAVYRFNSFDFKGIYSFILKSAADGSVFYGGCYGTEIDESSLRDVSLGIDICTFRREPFVERNIGIMNDNILNNPDCDLAGHLHVYISDNGQTLDIPRLSNDKIHIVPNKNVGGAGGFARGMIEALKHREEHHVTHLLLMDDDVIIEPEALIKTYHFLRMLKDSYWDAFIGGAMLRLDRPNIQVEAGAVWNAGHLDSLKSGLNLDKSSAWLYNETQEFSDYHAWWFCCFPIDVVTEQNLPMPIFIRGDDVEYGLRNMKRLIMLNGICVWHETFENKYSSFLEYYIVRNQLIDNALHTPAYSWKQFLKFLFRRVTRQAVYYRYKSVDLMLRATEDFMKGVDWLKVQDGEALHKDIMAEGYKVQYVEEIDIPFNYPSYDQSLILSQENKIHKIIRFVTLNGMLLRAKQNSVASMAAARPINFYRAKRVMNYDAGTQKGFVTEKSWKQFFRCYSRLFRLVFTGKAKFKKAQRDYQSRFGELTNLDFWEKYLGLNVNYAQKEE
jgi:galactofuranosylgalactofuranosylrhamnosyl-N-acetylglucosaminyl-diphospho-decaprenol beta-1,5/1,6-galactofuranosyltransferase